MSCVSAENVCSASTVCRHLQTEGDHMYSLCRSDNRADNAIENSMQRRLLLCGYALFCLICLWLSATLQEVQAETWEEAAIRLEREDRQEKVDAASRDLFYAITRSDTAGAALAIALGADVNQCVAYMDASRRRCKFRMLDYAVQMYSPDKDEDGGQAGLSMLRLLLKKGALLVEDDIVRKKRNSMALKGLFAKEPALLLFLESGYKVTPDLLAVAAQYRSPREDSRSSFPLQMLLKSGPYGVHSTFAASDFDKEVNATIVRHIHGLDHLDAPLSSTRDMRNISLLHLAAVTGNTEVASYLIRQGADISVRTSFGVNALEEAYSLWIYTWNDTVWGREYKFDHANFLDFIRLLMLHGMEADSIQKHYLEHPDVYEALFVRTCQESRISASGFPKDSVALGDFFKEHFVRASWELTRYDVLDSRASTLCTIVVTFAGTLASDHSHVKIPLVFLDNVLYVAGNEIKDIRYPILRNRHRLHTWEILDFWRSLGLDVEYDKDEEDSER